MKTKEIKKIAKKWFDDKTNKILLPSFFWIDSEDLQISCFIDGMKLSNKLINDEYAISYAEWFFDRNWNKNNLLSSEFKNQLEIFKKLCKDKI